MKTEVEIVNPGVALVRLRWDKATQAERLRVGKMLLAARRQKIRKGKVVVKHDGK